MKLYFAPGDCSLADHIALHESGLPFGHKEVDLKGQTGRVRRRFHDDQSQRFVPALTLDSGETLTETLRS